MWVLVLLEVGLALALVLSVLWVLRPRPETDEPPQKHEDHHENRQDTP
jgi:hypothetical protein